jgi:hypothetical protein
MKKAALFAPITLVFGLAAISPSLAMSGASIEIGRGDDSTTMARISARWDWENHWSINQNWITSGFWEASLGRLNADGTGSNNLWDIGLTPVFRLRSGVSTFYLEGAIGAHFLSKIRINNRRSLGSSFNFGDHVGFGWNFGDKDRYELGYRFQHLSNADLAAPNDGINFHQIRLGYNY